MAIEESFGGSVGDGIDTGITALLLPIIGVVSVILFFAWILTFFQPDLNDFKEAKIENKTIVCKGFAKTYTITHEDYYFENDKIKMKIFGPDFTFNINECKIK